MPYGLEVIMGILSKMICKFPETSVTGLPNYILCILHVIYSIMTCNFCLAIKKVMVDLLDKNISDLPGM